MAAEPAESSCSSPCPWSPRAADRRALDAPLDLRHYTASLRFDRGLSTLYHPSAVRGMHVDPHLTSFLELMCHNRDMRERLFKSTWYKTDYVTVREDRMYIVELALCSMDVVKTVLAYFPRMHVCACSAYFEPSTIGYLRQQLQLLVHGCAPDRLTLVHKQPNGERWMATYPPEDPALGIQWEPMQGELP